MYILEYVYLYRHIHTVYVDPCTLYMFSNDDLCWNLHPFGEVQPYNPAETVSNTFGESAPTNRIQKIFVLVIRTACSSHQGLSQNDGIFFEIL